MDGAYTQIILLVIVITSTLIAAVITKFSLGRFVTGNDDENESPDSSAILSYYTAGHSLISGGRGKVADMSYSLYATLPPEPSQEKTIAFVDESAVIYSLDLPFNTESHFIGLSKDHKLDRLQFESFLIGQGMEKVVLEGDFPDYFDIYAAKGQQFAVRTVLEPDSMNFVVSYCRSHFWEINSSQMYFVDSESDNTQKDNLPLLEQSLQFVAQIKPALMPGQPGAAVVHHDVPYGEYGGPALLCPLCQKTMTMQDNCQVCPDGQGILISGRDLVAYHTGKSQINAQLAATDMAHGELTCPNCHNMMTPTGYEGGPIQIDSCEHCPFRWLDASEVAALAPKTKA